MSVIATAVRHLMAAGVTGEALLTAIAEMEEQIRAEPKPRSAGALRQERYRRNKASLVTESDACDAARSLPLPPNENNSNPPPPTHPETPPREGARTRRAPAGDEFPRPEWADAEVWRDFLTNRKRKHLPNTATAYRGFLADIAKLATDEWPPGRLLEHAAMKGWGAIYEPDEMKEQTNGRQFGTGGKAAPTGGRNFAGNPGVVDIAQQVLADRRARSLAAGTR